MIRVSSVGALAALLAAGFAAPASAQTFEACRVPAVGVIYMINVGDAPTACLDPSHVQFTWTEGGAPPSNSVTSAMIVDGTLAAVDHAFSSVSSPAIVDGSVALVDHAAGSVNSATIVDGSVAAADLAAGLVVGVEFGKDFAFFDPTTTATTAASLSLSHPASGYIVAHALGQVSCSVDTSVLLGVSNGTTAIDGWTNIAPVTGNFSFVYKQDVFAVTGAGTATVNFNVQLGADNCTYFRAINFDAIYVPARY
jgi:hypothetical protein